MRGYNRKSVPRIIPVTDGELDAMKKDKDDPRNPANDEQAPREDIQARIDELEQALAETDDRWKRTAAEFDNYRKRMQRDMEMFRRRERETVLMAWIEVIDNMERALADEGAASNPWYEGVEAIHQQMLGVLKKFGAEPFDACGETFDPRRHEAIATANMPGQPEGLVVEVIQTGYVMDGTVLRHAKVIPVKHS